MESFFLTETLKYLYLLFSPDHVMHQEPLMSRIVFSTEAHPLYLPDPIYKQHRPSCVKIAPGCTIYPHGNISSLTAHLYETMAPSRHTKFPSYVPLFPIADAARIVRWDMPDNRSHPHYDPFLVHYGPKQCHLTWPPMKMRETKNNHNPLFRGSFEAALRAGEIDLQALNSRQMTEEEE